MSPQPNRHRRPSPPPAPVAFTCYTLWARAAVPPHIDGGRALVMQPFGKQRPVKVVIEDEIEIQWTNPVTRGRRGVNLPGAAEPEPEPEPEQVAASAWSDDDDDGELAGQERGRESSWQGRHPAIDAMSGAALGKVLARASDTRSLEEVRGAAEEQQAASAPVPSFPAAGPAREVVDWLGRAGLAAHAQALVSAGLSSMDHCASVTPEDLAAAGMTEPEMKTFYAALREDSAASAESEELESEQGAVLSAPMADQRDKLLQLLPESMRALYEERTLAANVASMSQPADPVSAPPLARADGLPSAAELEAAAAQPGDLWIDAEPAQWDVEDATPASWDEEDAEDSAAAEEARKRAAFADEDEADEVEETEDATAAEVARLQAEVDRWQKKVSELADASDAQALVSARDALFADADEDGSGLEDRLGLEAAVEAMSAAQSAMQQRVGRMSSGSSASKGATGSRSKAPPMMVMRPMTGPTKGK